MCVFNISIAQLAVWGRLGDVVVGRGNGGPEDIDIGRCELG